MAALQYVDIPGYNAILIRDTYQNLSKPEALIPVSHEWLSGTDAVWHGGERLWEFPHGDEPSSTVSFGYLDGPMDHFNFQSSAYQYVGIDEIVQIRENQALYLFSRLRRLETHKQIPIRFRAASNPPAREQVARGGWVKARYVDSETRGGRIFIPAGIDDNPYLDKEEYIKSLMELDPITRQQLMKGDWNVKATGGLFKRHWFEVVDSVPTKSIKWIRYWDMAATEEKVGRSESSQPAFTSGCKMGMTPDGLYFIASIIRDRLSPRHAEALVRQTADMDGKEISIWMEQEPGSSGKMVIDHYRRNVLRGFVFRGDPVSKAKVTRAGPFASQAEGGNVFLVRGAWVSDFLDEIELYPNGPFLDQVDSASGAFNKLVSASGVPRISFAGASTTKAAPRGITTGLTRGGEMVEVYEGGELVGMQSVGGGPRPYIPGIR